MLIVLTSFIGYQDSNLTQHKGYYQTKGEIYNMVEGEFIS